MKGLHWYSRQEMAERLESYIAQRELAPHAKLPAERVLSEEWGCHRNTLRAGIRTLVSQGLIYTRKNSGTYVAPAKLRRDLHSFEPLAQVAARAGRKLSVRLLECTCTEANKSVARRLQLPLGAPVYRLRRLRKLASRPILVETSFLSAQRFAGLERHDFSYLSLYGTLEQTYDTVLVEGDESISVTYLDEAEAELLGMEPGEAAFLLTGVVSDAKGTPVEAFSSVLRGDLVGFSHSIDF